MTPPRKKIPSQAGFEPGIFRSRGRRLLMPGAWQASHKTSSVGVPDLPTRLTGQRHRGRHKKKKKKKIAFKGAIRDFLQSPRSAANCLQHARSSGPGAIVCKSRATHRALITCKCHVTCHLVRSDSSAIKFDRVEIAFI